MDFLSVALREGARRWRNGLVLEEDATAPALSSFLPPVSAALGRLAEIRATRTASLAQQRSHPKLAAAQRRMMTHFGEAEATGEVVPRGRSPSRDSVRGDMSRSVSPARSRSPTSRPSPRPSSTGFTIRVTDNVAGDGFFYTDRNGNPSSDTLMYAPLESHFGATRHQLDFAVLMSSAPTPDQRLTKCRYRHDPRHHEADSPAHRADPSKLAEARANPSLFH